LSGADTRGSEGLNLIGATRTNTILPDGTIEGLDLRGLRSLLILDHDGNPLASPAPLGPIPIRIEQQLLMDGTSILKLLFEEDAWDSVISFDPGITVTLGGKLGLDFAPGVDVAGQRGRTFRIFDWSGVSPSGQFQIVSPYTWDVSRLYTTGEVTLVPEPSALGLGMLALLLACTMTRRGLRVALTGPNEPNYFTGPCRFSWKKWPELTGVVAQTIRFCDRFRARGAAGRRPFHAN
jgi:hypothetical protein